MGGLLLVMIVVCFYGTVQNGLDFMTFFTRFIYPAMLVINIFKTRKLRKEIGSKEYAKKIGRYIKSMISQKINTDYLVEGMHN